LYLSGAFLPLDHAKLEACFYSPLSAAAKNRGVIPAQ
jgi:hypothetical protein